MRTRIPSLLFLIIMCLLANYLHNKETIQPTQSLKSILQSNPISNPNKTTSHLNPTDLKKNMSAQKQVHNPQTEPTKSATIKMTQTMTSLLQNYVSQNNLKTTLMDLKKRQFKPFILKDSNPYTGNMYILRTNNSLPGARYFHAQYFSDKNQSPYLQHMSFEIPPGKDSFQTALNIVRQTFPGLSAPVETNDDFVMWHWKNGYTIWVQKMSPKQIVDDPFNAYTAKDVGTIKIAMELDAH